MARNATKKAPSSGKSGQELLAIYLGNNSVSKADLPEVFAMFGVTMGSAVGAARKPAKQAKAAKAKAVRAPKPAAEPAVARPRPRKQVAAPANNGAIVVDVPVPTRSLRIGKGTVAPTMPGVRAPADPWVPVDQSVTADHIICLEDGKKFKMMKRHLRATYGMTPEQYRAKWNLPSDYPMVAPGYSREKSDYAKMQGLGTAENKNHQASSPKELARALGQV